jgi:hypothetical protein
MHTGDFWWKEQSTLPPGGTLVPLICGSDKTLLTTMAGNHSAWPVYLTVGNIPEAFRRKLSQNAALLLALLPKFPKGHSAASNREAIHKTLTTIFEPLRVYSLSGLNMDCADGSVC